ncbi:cell wall-associated NlpC family hydrolase [Nonomuraea fuscirosea]|uniref:Cell wall-associated NlpC family hydrolase n=1 Tax=Nonomuraea fuscirosea TaxID=1291556 RepID=A0A2T0N0P5_9ACTN|nr:NlpC/P60 family protein [Nonomuraea fuscirosea]PRX65343.1 cell wall-associated NlpC family hydrolase [Nonomuraea fuscirosea]
MTTRITFLRLAIGGALLSALLTTLIINTTPAQATPEARSTSAHTAAARAVSTEAVFSQAAAARSTSAQAAAARVVATRAAPVQASTRATSAQPAPDPAAAAQAISTRAAPVQTTPDQATSDQAAPEQVTPGQATQDQAAPEQVPPGQTAADQATPDQATPDRVAAAGAVVTLPIPSPASKLPKLKGPLTRGQIAAAAALTQLGVSFSWGGGSAKGPTLGIGRGATTRGFDCSGLTLYAWSRAGIQLSHHTSAQFRQGRRIPLSARRTGDLLFFGGNPGAPTHVALFLTGTLMIHAPKTGDVVRRANFNTPYFRTTYRGTVRPG